MLLKISNILELTVLFFCLRVGGGGAGGGFLSFSVPAGTGKNAGTVDTKLSFFAIDDGF